MQHLQKRGYQRIACISDRISLSRVTVFKQAMKLQGMKVDPQLICVGPERAESGGYLRTKELLSLENPPGDGEHVLVGIGDGGDAARDIFGRREVVKAHDGHILRDAQTVLVKVGYTSLRQYMVAVKECIGHFIAEYALRKLVSGIDVNDHA